MTAMTTSRPRFGKMAMILAASAAVMLFAVPKAAAWDQTVGDFTVSRTKSSEQAASR